MSVPRWLPPSWFSRRRKTPTSNQTLWNMSEHKESVTATAPTRGGSRGRSAPRRASSLSDKGLREGCAGPSLNTATALDTSDIDWCDESTSCSSGSDTIYDAKEVIPSGPLEIHGVGGAASRYITLHGTIDYKKSYPAPRDLLSVGSAQALHDGRFWLEDLGVLCAEVERIPDLKPVGLAMRRRITSIREGVFSFETRVAVETEDKMKRIQIDSGEECDYVSSTDRDSTIVMRSIGTQCEAEPVMAPVERPTVGENRAVAECDGFSTEMVGTAIERLIKIMTPLEDKIKKCVQTISDTRRPVRSDSALGASTSGVTESAEGISAPAAVEAGADDASVVGRRRGRRKPSLLETSEPLSSPGSCSTPAGRVQRDTSLRSRGRSGASTVVVRPSGPETNIRDLMQNMKSGISPEDLGIKTLRTRMTKDGGCILEIPDPDGADKASQLASRMRLVLGDNARILRPTRLGVFRLSDLDILT